MGSVFEEANPEQREAIETTEGPLLIVAGPGTGKTHTLVLRIVNLVVNHHVPLSRIFLATFTVKAANEFTKRLATALGEHGIRPNFDEAYIGTFHSICERLLRENPDVSGLQRSFATKDQFDQELFVHGHMGDFAEIPRFREYFEEGADWENTEKICNEVNILQEELIPVEVLAYSGDPDAEFFGSLLKKYMELREASNFIDFTLMQTAVYRMMQDPEVRKRIADKFDYVLVDEYQDTNHVQEQLTYLFGSASGNICVVGDEDQAIYRFRGATVRNILEFPRYFPGCSKVVLTGNYRSHPGIVGFFNRWMENTHVTGVAFDWGKLRNPKTIEAVGDIRGDYGSVSVCPGGDTKALCENVYLTIKSMKDAGKITDYNQVAFLFKSVRKAFAGELEDYLLKQGIQVFSPRSGRFFHRHEVKAALGMLLSLIPASGAVVSRFGSADYRGYFTDCLRIADRAADGDPGFAEWRDSVRRRLSGGETLPMAFSGMLYRLFAFKPLRGYLDRAAGNDLGLQKPARNLALLVSYLRKYEAGRRMTSMVPAKAEQAVRDLLLGYFHRMYRKGVYEYEDDEVYAPSGHVSFFTIHQSKGLEFPVVFVDLPTRGPMFREESESFQRILDSYSGRMTFEPPEMRPYADFWREMYVAFSRAESQLVLLRNLARNQGPSECFEDALRDLPAEVDPPALSLKPMGSHPVMRSYAYTTDAGAYGRCQRHYCLQRVLGFADSDLVGMAFGSLVHGILEAVNNAVIAEGPGAVGEDRVRGWGAEMYGAIRRAYPHVPLPREHQDVAVRQVLAYVERMDGRWDTLYASEMPVSVIHGDYVIEGKVDLVLKTAGGYEVVDYKTGEKPG